ncbi:ATP-binding protein [Acinetobacter zhairhuonensis]|uniref:ATP-binding protein n=1 Tax=Acinetobacter sp. A7.4 TaxID=2919921 RepID=UPI001F4FC261|nr:AAA family ATPase [Acinetobacter sp. A7.4]MCJ8162570.1 AAA family ATPase [Acinetobacter sp. A7.4]
MKIKSLQLKHTNLFANLQLQFHYHDQPITLILGDQASGKTSILKHAYQALTWFSARYKDLRSAGVVMLDQDIMHSRLQSKVQISVEIPADIGTLAESETAQPEESNYCRWQLYKTLNQQGIGLSKAETDQLEQLVQLYHRALQQDPMQGLPLIAYYPAERFVNEINLLSKNNPIVFQAGHAYEVAAIPFTTFSRFFEWFREISDLENAQTAQLFQQLMRDKLHLGPHLQPENVPNTLFQAHIQLHAPCLKALKDSLKIIVPELNDIFVQYQPKLQLMVNYQGKVMQFQQLSSSQKNWIALIGDIVRRMCLLNPLSLYPCLEGDGVLLIDAIDEQLDQNHCSLILQHLHQVFPRLQIIATGNRTELLENAAAYQCLQLSSQGVQNIMLHPLQQQFDQIYAELSQISLSGATALEQLSDEPTISAAQQLYAQIQQLSPEAQAELQQLWQQPNDSSFKDPSS